MTNKHTNLLGLNLMHGFTSENLTYWWKNVETKIKMTQYKFIFIWQDDVCCWKQPDDVPESSYCNIWTVQSLSSTSGYYPQFKCNSPSHHFTVSYWSCLELPWWWKEHLFSFWISIRSITLCAIKLANATWTSQWSGKFIYCKQLSFVLINYFLQIYIWHGIFMISNPRLKVLPFTLNTCRFNLKFGYSGF